MRYTREVLTEAAARCGDLDEVITFLKVKDYRRLRAHLLKRFARFGIDVSHFPADRPARAVIERPTSGELRSAVSHAFSVSGALRHLGLVDNGTTRRRFHTWVAHEGLDTGHFTGRAHRKGQRSPHARPAQDILRRHEGRRRTSTALLRRALHESGVVERCASCGTGPRWQGRRMTLEIDHVNGNWRDDRKENLRFLCPNCHAVTSTWCRGGGTRAVGSDSG